MKSAVNEALSWFPIVSTLLYLFEPIGLPLPMNARWR